MHLPPSIILTIAVLTAFFIFIVAVKFAVEDDFKRTRLTMTAFFFFIIATLTICFSQFFVATLPYTVPAGLLGVVAGFFIGVPASAASNGGAFSTSTPCSRRSRSSTWWALRQCSSTTSSRWP